MTKYHKGLYTTFILLMLLLSPSNIKAEEVFIENFERDEMLLNYSIHMDDDTSILLSDDQQYSGDKSLKLLNSNPFGECYIKIPLNIDFSVQLIFNLFQYFVEGEPYYQIGVEGESNGINREIILQYGNPYADWVGESSFLVRGFNTLPNEWYLFSTNITQDLEQAIRHAYSPIDIFAPSHITFLSIGLESAPFQKTIFIDAIQIDRGDSNQKIIGLTTSLHKFEKTFFRSISFIVFLTFIILLFRLKSIVHST